MITGEHKLRENLGELYGGVNGYFGKPTQSQIERTAVLKTQLDAAAAKFNGVASKDVVVINAALTKDKLQPVVVLTREDWEKQQK